MACSIWTNWPEREWKKNNAVGVSRSARLLRTTLRCWGVLLAIPFVLHAQIDPYKRELIQIGYNAAFEGHAPLSAYAFYYRNVPSFVQTNWTLRLAIAPTYLDSELGIDHALGENTSLGIGLAGGGFADSYAEIRRGVYRPKESFYGHGGELNTSIYHLFNPQSLVPLNGVLRTSARFSTYDRTDKTADDFQLPDDRGDFTVRGGLRWGGREPTLFPQVAMELSIWYQGEFRTDNGTYGFHDRYIEQFSHLFWGHATLAYQTPWNHLFDVSLSLGTSIDPDRFSAYRLGALLPLISEFPLSLPGYYYQEISARSFVLFSANYLLPLDSLQRWNINLTAATAVVDYLPGLEQPGNSHTGVGGGILYRRNSIKVMVGYAYGVDALRHDQRGAHSIGMLMQLDWGSAKHQVFNPTSPNLWRGLQRVFGLFGE